MYIYSIYIYIYTHLYLCEFYFYNYVNVYIYTTVLSIQYSDSMHAYAWLIEMCFRCLVFTSPDFWSDSRPEPSTGLFRTKMCGTILATYYFAITPSTVPAPAQTTRNQPRQEVWHTAMCMLWARCRVSRYEHSSYHYSAMPHLRGVWQLEKMPFVVRSVQTTGWTMDYLHRHTTCTNSGGDSIMIAPLYPHRQPA